MTIWLWLHAIFLHHVVFFTITKFWAYTWALGVTPRICHVLRIRITYGVTVP